jgi:peptidoglycan hydrolase CwlO-like protein
MLIVINREHIDVSIKTGDNTVKELQIEKEDLLRGREVEKDSMLKLHQTLTKRDSAIAILEYKIKKQNKKIDSLSNTIRTMQMSGSLKKIVK